MDLDKVRYKGNKTAFMKELEGFCIRNNRQKPSKEQKAAIWQQLQTMSNPFNFDFRKACDSAKILEIY